MRSTGRWSIWVDTGGTFTDCVARDPSGEIHRAKVLSNGSIRGRLVRRLTPTRLELELPWALPDDFLAGWGIQALTADTATVAIARSEGAAGVVELSGPLDLAERADVELTSGEEAAVVAARLVTGTPHGDELPPLELRLATTRGTNALLERRGAATALFVTRGFADLLEIGNQQRPELFALQIVKPRPFYRRVVEVDERLAADGSVLRPLDLEALGPVADDLLTAGIRVAAVSLLHSYRQPEHERRLARFLVERGFEHVSMSADLAPLIRYLPRAETAVVDAFLAPVVGGYVEQVRSSLGAQDLKMMTSAGGLVSAERFRSKDSLLSGPAGGVVGAVGAGRRSAVERVIAFDMGGTSTDVSRFDGEFDYRFDTRVGDAHLMAPALAIETVAAGGGSICDFDGVQLRVGPESAGARPGPACYGAGGPLTVTDVNLLLGRLRPDRFEIPIDPTAAERRATAVLERVRAAGEPDLAPEALLAGFLQIANERMAEAVRRISVREGYDPAEYAIVAFGGAGAQHACALAELLGIDRVVVPRDAGLLSAQGLGHAVVERFRERQVLAPLNEVEERLAGWLEELGREARRAVGREGVPESAVEVRLRRVHLRLSGQDATLAIDFGSGASLRRDFDRAYREVYGYRPEARTIEVESLRVVASSSRPELEAAPVTHPGPVPSAAPAAEARAFVGGSWIEVPIFDRDALTPGVRIAGPCLISERHSATLVETDWQMTVDDAGALVLRPGASDV